MTELIMPTERKYGWALKTMASTCFTSDVRPNGQISVVLNHSLLRGVRAEMIAWWFKNFPNLRVKLVDIEGYENQYVPGYLLWHPSDHYGATLKGKLGPGNTAIPGAKIHIQEAMQHKTYGWRYKVDTALSVFYVGQDGWAMGRRLPIFGDAMVLRIHFKDVDEDGQHIGVHYHYEIVAGVTGNNPAARAINRKLTAHFDQEFWDAWHLHNAIEVGVFENFLPALYAQRDDVDNLRFDRSTDAAKDAPAQTQGFDRNIFEQRSVAFLNSQNPFETLNYTAATFL